MTETPITQAEIAKGMMKELGATAGQANWLLKYIQDLEGQTAMLTAVRRSNRQHMDLQDERIAHLEKELIHLVLLVEPVIEKVPGLATMNGSKAALNYCKTCCVKMKIGQAILQTWTAGLPDFIGDKNPSIQTMSPGGPGKLVTCLKCPNCGHSTN